MEPWLAETASKLDDGKEVTKEQGIPWWAHRQNLSPHKVKIFQRALTWSHSLGIAHSPALCPQRAFQDRGNLPVQQAVAGKWQGPSHHRATLQSVPSPPANTCPTARLSISTIFSGGSLTGPHPPSQWKWGALVSIHRMPYAYVLPTFAFPFIHWLIYITTFLKTTPLC